MKKILVVFPGALLLVLVGAPNVWAATTVTKSDPRGDQRSYSSPNTTRMKTSADIRSVTVTSDATRLKVTFKLRDLALSPTESAKYSVSLQVDSGGTIPAPGRMAVTVTKSKTVASYGGWRKAQCAAGVRGSRSFADDVATVSIPVACLPAGSAIISTASDVKSGSGLVQDRGPDFASVRIR